MYPWVGDFESERANTSESGIGRTTAVGLFPRGVSQYQALDMAGNTWEWCSSLYKRYRYDAEDGREDWKQTVHVACAAVRGTAEEAPQGARFASGPNRAALTSIPVFGSPSSHSLDLVGNSHS